MDWQPEHGFLAINTNCPEEGDITIVCFAEVDTGDMSILDDMADGKGGGSAGVRLRSLSVASDGLGSTVTRVIFRHSFHTGFLSSGAVRLSRSNVDIVSRRYVKLSFDELRWIDRDACFFFFILDIRSSFVV